MHKGVLTLISVALLSNVMAGEAKFSGDTHFAYVFKDMDENSYQINRAYFTYEKQVTDALSYKFQTDVGTGGATAYTVYLKNAVVSWKTDFGKISLGLQGMNMFKVQEENWGYRFVEKSAMDIEKYASSADLGVGWTKSLGMLTPSVMLTNGTGYKKTEDDGHKKLSVNLLYGPAKLKKGLNAGVAFSFEPKDYDLVDGSSTTTETGSTIVLAAYGGWAQGPLKLGAEFASLNQELESSMSSNLVSAYGDFMLRDNLSVFGRFDMYTDDAASNAYTVFGVNFSVEKGLYIAPNIQVDMPDGGDAEMTYRVNFRFKI